MINRYGDYLYQEDENEKAIEEYDNHETIDD